MPEPESERRDVVHRSLTDLDDALVLLQEVEFAMRHVPIKQGDRTPEEQMAVERFTTYWTWVRDVLRQHGFAPAPVHREEEKG